MRCTRSARGRRGARCSRRPSVLRGAVRRAGPLHRVRDRRDIVEAGERVAEGRGEVRQREVPRAQDAGPRVLDRASAGFHGRDPRDEPCVRGGDLIARLAHRIVELRCARARRRASTGDRASGRREPTRRRDPPGRRPTRPGPGHRKPVNGATAPSARNLYAITDARLSSPSPAAERVEQRVASLGRDRRLVSLPAAASTCRICWRYVRHQLAGGEVQLEPGALVRGQPLLEVVGHQLDELTAGEIGDGGRHGRSSRPSRSST